MDTTLRDGEQSPGVAFSPGEKLAIARNLLERVGVDRVEVASARVSPGETLAAARIARYAKRRGLSHRVEALGYCDGELSAEWFAQTGLTRLNLLVKGSREHCEHQLRSSPEGHVSAARRSIEAAAARGVSLSGVWLEDWSRGYASDPEYVLWLVSELTRAGAARFYLADTLGVLSPRRTFELVSSMVSAFPESAFEFHAHDDYGLATANGLAAVSAGARGLHVTVNGLGERAGNACLSEVAVSVRDHAGALTQVDERALGPVSALVARASGRPVPEGAPVIGRDAFTHTAGIHADGDQKHGLYSTRLSPERFGREREVALGKLSGKASLMHHLERRGLSPSRPELEALLEQVVALGDEKRPVTVDDLVQLCAKIRAAATGGPRPDGSLALAAPAAQGHK